MKKILKLKEEIIPLSSKQNVGILLIIVSIFQFILFFSPALAEKAEQNELNKSEFKINLSAENFDENINLKENLNTYKFPEHESLYELYNNKEYKVIRTDTHTMTAYNSEAAQTDSSPCITANGFNVCNHNIEDTVAANFLKFGTKIRIPELFGDRIFVVRDRMNARYTSRVDIWMIDKNDAIKFGVKKVKIEILEKI